MGVFAHVAWTGHALLMTHLGNRLRDRENVGFVKTVAQRTAAMA